MFSDYMSLGEDAQSASKYRKPFIKTDVWAVIVATPMLFSWLLTYIVFGVQGLAWLKTGEWHWFTLADAKTFVLPEWFITEYLGLNNILGWLYFDAPLVLWLAVFAPLIWCFVTWVFEGWVSRNSSVWLLTQCTIMIAVLWTGTYYEWTPNKVALGIIAIGAAWLAKKIVSALLSLPRVFREWRAGLNRT